MEGVAKIKIESLFRWRAHILIGLFRFAEIERHTAETAVILEMNIRRECGAPHPRGDSQSVGGGGHEGSLDVLGGKSLLQQARLNEWLQGKSTVEGKRSLPFQMVDHRAAPHQSEIEPSLGMLVKISGSEARALAGPRNPASALGQQSRDRAGRLFLVHARENLIGGFAAEFQPIIQWIQEALLKKQVGIDQGPPHRNTAVFRDPEGHRRLKPYRFQARPGARKPASKFS